MPARIHTPQLSSHPYSTAALGVFPFSKLHAFAPCSKLIKLPSSTAGDTACESVLTGIYRATSTTGVLRRAGIGMAASGLPPGYRFYPTEEELICFYLRNKLDGLRDDIERVIPVFEVYTVDPWQLTEIHERLCGGAGEGEPWFFFCPRQEREARGGRPSRTTPSGYWKAAGTPGAVYAADRRAIGMKKTMVFYRGRAPSGIKTTWKMNEYRALQYDADGTTDGSSSSAHAAAAAGPLNLPSQLRSEFSLCRLYTQSGVLRQFDRRPPAAAASGPGEDPGPSTAAAGSPVDDDGSGGSMLQMQLMERGGSNPYGEDVGNLDDLLYWPGD